MIRLSAGWEQRETGPRAAGEDQLAARQPDPPGEAAVAAMLLRSMADAWQAEVVQAARTGYSWEEIVGALGTSKQSAHERFRR
ncbi:hypothetical protein Sros01_03360 [Streptomyces roseochromogenus]|nr:hypothetical protein Sros01_03360 [Streptomyces roseochromogenus]